MSLGVTICFALLYIALGFVQAYFGVIEKGEKVGKEERKKRESIYFLCSIGQFVLACIAVYIAMK